MEKTSSGRTAGAAARDRRRTVVQITKRVEFSATHRLYNPDFSDEKNWEVFGICNNPNGHGHNYTLDVTLRGEPDPATGMIIDLKELKEILDERLVDRVDHKNLNLDVDFLSDCVPTVENLIIRFWEVLDGRIPGCDLDELVLYESRTNFARYRGPEGG
ncbi:MAG: 6-carboxytetrahydropterin synthase [Candidatus Eisenbacteria bacterium]|nr:6-carboxytetrahydropterin synthase [Candidatus Eisenbacteria bacterium]